MDGTASRSRARGFRIVATLFIVLLTAGICYGAVRPRTASPGADLAGVFSTGPLAVAGGSAVFDARALAPGQTVTGSVVLSNDGGAPGRFWLGTDISAGTSSPAGSDLGRALQVVVTEVGGAGRSLYRGTLAGLSAVDLGTFTPRAVRAFRVAVTLPRQVAAYVAGDALSVRLHWTAVAPG
jgi:hypothetical protein